MKKLENNNSILLEEIILIIIVCVGVYLETMDWYPQSIAVHLFTYLYLSFIFSQIFELFFHEYNENEQTTFTT